ncbi:MAG TPA: hypothetical protein VFQ65_11055, partial [Kofleriaceae bacterium]|nr:hypothetical protein [Kofleriaceae bacterium]
TTNNSSKEITMSALDNLLDSVKQSIVDHVQQGGHQNFDTGGLLGKITDLFTKHAQSPDRNIVPASRDPYGDPADQRGNVKPASQDPYGDPANQRR